MYLNAYAMVLKKTETDINLDAHLPLKKENTCPLKDKCTKSKYGRVFQIKVENDLQLFGVIQTIPKSGRPFTKIERPVNV